MSDYDTNLDRAAKVLGANVIKMVSLILQKHDAAIIEASMEAIEQAREEEREACAQIVEQYCGAWDDKGFALASAIRARGGQ